MTAVLLTALVVFVACGPPARPPGVVVFASGADLESANPLVTIHGLSRQVQRFVLFTTLARYDSALAPAPYLAREWRWSNNRATLTFSLHTGLTWHDGTPTTARDVAFTLLVARDPRTGYPRGTDLSAIDTVRAADDSTVTIEFADPQPLFPLVLCELPILPEHLLRDVQRSEMRRAPFNLAPVGNGPFRFVERIPGQRWVFESDSTFPAALGGPPNIQRLVIAVVDEPTTKLAGLTSSDLDFAGIAPTMAALAARDPTIRVMDYPILLSTALIFNTHRPPFDDTRVRAAIDASLDRDRIVRAALAGYGRPAAGPVPPESPLALARSPLHDDGVADSLLDAAGWARGTDGRRSRDGVPLKMELLTVGSGDNAVEQLIQADLGERGIAVEIRQLEMGAFLTRARAAPKAFDALVTGVPGDLSLSSLGAMYDSRQRGGALDYGDYHTPELDALFGVARRAAANDLPDAWRAIQTVLARDVPAVWIYHSRGLQGVSRNIENVTFDLRGELESIARWRVTPR
ncbi:MAG: peptide ABC transporter substrate-binding protein [Gemmatimonadetes bacterium]|nr:peptide ABC transporter substrate-binding protein [Gemmatimonadota bacterium]